MGKLNLQDGEPILSTFPLKEKLAAVWALDNFKVVPISKGYYTILLHFMVDQSKVISIRAIDLKPGTFRISQWMKDVNPVTQ